MSQAELKGNIKQTVCQWCYEDLGLEVLAASCPSIGLVGIDLVDVKDWAVLIKHGLVCSMTMSHTIEKGLNRIENHAECLAKIRKGIEDTSAAGFSNVICFSKGAFRFWIGIIGPLYL